jgi:hypothetical protein
VPLAPQVGARLFALLQQLVGSLHWLSLLQLLGQVSCEPSQRECVPQVAVLLLNVHWPEALQPAAHGPVHASLQQTKPFMATLGAQRVPARQAVSEVPLQVWPRIFLQLPRTSHCVPLPLVQLVAVESSTPVPELLACTTVAQVPSLPLPNMAWQFRHAVHAEALQHTPSRQLAKPA